jgi:tRNA nucleotidyltransferase (CCA-adding enzyme)
MEDPLFLPLEKIYAEHGYSLYIVGGEVRDLLLKRPFSDRDYVTDATPAEEKAFITNASYTYERFGSVKLKVENQEIDITTLRKEEEYQDFRHPGKVIFVKTPEEDYRRRDFTINALYLTKEGKVLDYCGGLEDLQRKIIRFVGEPEKRVQEDPLRILRAERFASSLSFTIEEKTQDAIDKYRYLLAELNPAKIKEEERKGWKRIK